MARSATKRKTLMKLLGDSGIRDFKSAEEMDQAKRLYDLMVKSDVPELTVPTIGEIKDALKKNAPLV